MLVSGCSHEVRNKDTSADPRYPVGAHECAVVLRSTTQYKEVHNSTSYKDACPPSDTNKLCLCAGSNRKV